MQQHPQAQSWIVDVDIQLSKQYVCCMLITAFCMASEFMRLGEMRPWEWGSEPAFNQVRQHPQAPSWIVDVDTQLPRQYVCCMLITAFPWHLI